MAQCWFPDSYFSFLWFNVFYHKAHKPRSIFINISFIVQSYALVVYYFLKQCHLCSMYTFCHFIFSSFFSNHIGGVIVSVLASSAVDCGFESQSGQTKDYKIGICCFSAKHVALRRKSKDWLAWIRIMCPSGATCLSTDCTVVSVNYHYKNSTRHVGLV